MATPLDPSLKSYIDAIIVLCDQKILSNQPNPNDPVPIATDKTEQIAAWNAYKSKALEFYGL